MRLAPPSVNGLSRLARRRRLENTIVIMTRSPLRVSLGGGGTDLPSYYREHGGFLVAAAIDKYVYILMHHRFVPRILLKYSQMEEVDRIENIKASIDPRVATASGVGKITDWKSTVWPMSQPEPAWDRREASPRLGLLKALHISMKNLVHPADLAEQASKIEIEILKEPVRQTGPIHRGLWRDHLLPLPPQWASGSLATED